jgi:hypothetical protein
VSTATVTLAPTSTGAPEPGTAALPAEGLGRSSSPRTGLVAVAIPLLHLAVPGELARSTSRITRSRWWGRSSATPRWRWRWIWCGATPASSRWATGSSSPSAATRWGMYLMRGHRARRGLRRSAAARLHGVPRLEGAALVLARLGAIPPAGAAGGPGPGAPGLRLRLVRLPLADPRGLLLDHHPGADLRGDAALLPEPDLASEGNNGFTDFKRILGFPLASPRTPRWCC